MTISVLTPLQLIAGASLLQNSGISTSPTLTAAINAYLSTPLLTAYYNALNNGAPIYDSTANTVPAFTNSIPSAYDSLLKSATATYVPSGSSGTTLKVNSTTGIIVGMYIDGTGFTSGQTVTNKVNTTTLIISAPPDSTPSGALTFTSGNMTSTILTQSAHDAGNGDISKFVQAVNLVLGYSEVTNQFINSAVNSQTYLANTFTTTNDMITGDVTKINLATPAFGTDLVNLGNLIDLGNLVELGSPLALVQQIIKTTGNIPVVSVAFLLAGVPQDTILNLSNPSISVTDSIQKLMYKAMTAITGTDLDQILKVLKITTTGINTMADLLNPLKLFPNSYLSLSVTTPNGVRAIYLNNAGAVNTQLKTELPAYVVSLINRLEVIIPPDQALSNKALAVALKQVTGISNTQLPSFSATVKNLQTTRDLPLITALTTAVPPSVANYYTSTLAIGAGTNGTIRVVDVIGLAAGWVATDAFTQTVAIFDTMDLTALTTIYETMYHALIGDYGDPEAGPLTIPSGLPCAGTYVGTLQTEPNPDPPPPDITYYDPTAVGLALLCLTGAEATEVATLETKYPNQTTELNTLWNNMCDQVVQENNLQTLINLNYADLQANSRNAIYGFIFNLPQYGLQTEVGGMAWFIENMADLTTQGGQAVVACLREGHNQAALNVSGIYTNNRIPADPNPPPPTAELLPADYTAAEAAALVIR